MNKSFYILAFIIVLVLAALTQAQTFTTLYNFSCEPGGCYPEAGVIQDPAGNLYGTTYWGGHSGCISAVGCGVVYELNPAAEETVLHTFTGPDGAEPQAALVRDGNGNIYGTTEWGGTSSGCYAGCGTVFKIDSAGNESVLHSFTGGDDGCFPYQGLVADKFGNLYGTALGCGAYLYGTIFKIDLEGRFKLLHGFTGYVSDGARPMFGRPTMDKYGNVYGATYWGGAYGNGVLYKLSKNGKLAVLHSFGGPSGGAQPYGSVVREASGNFFGTTTLGGSNNQGTIWKVSKTGKETILYSFAACSGYPGTCGPWAGVARDSKGNLYGTTYGGGTSGYGMVYELSASGNFTVLHNFDGSDGSSPIGEALWNAGALYGTTSGWGSYISTVWKYVP